MIFAEALKHHQGGNLEEAERLYRQTIKLDPGHIAAHSNRGAALQALGRTEDAVASYQKAIALKPDYFDAFNNAAVALLSLGRLDEAAAFCQQALALKADSAEAQFNMGAIFQALGQPQHAVLAYQRGLSLRPGSAEVHFNVGVALRALNRPSEALESFGKALGLNPNHAEAHYEMGLILRGEKRLEDSLISFSAALKANPDLKYARGDYLHTKMQLCDWDNFNTEMVPLIERSARSGKTASPFALSTLTDRAAPIRKAAEFTIADLHPENLKLGALPKAPRRDKIRLGYFSSDYEVHPVAHAIVGIMEAHDKNRFEVFAVSLGRDSRDDMRRRISLAVDDFIDVREKSDDDAALLARAKGIDIAIDLNGLTGGNRPGIFARRAAPIQVNYLGYGGTMGAPYFDYIVADRTLIPDQCRQFYSEQIAYLPNTCLPKSSLHAALHPAADDRNELRARAGLPKSAFVFCCFNNSYKIIPAMFDAWMRVLSQVEGSVLWLREESETISRNLRKEAAARGVAPERLIFAKRVSQEAYFQRYLLADLFLDTWPYTAGSVARECLWAGLPLLTLVGESYVSRMAASLLNVLGLSELAASAIEHYEAIALDLARNSGRLKQQKEALGRSRISTPCFDTQLLTRNLEHAYAQMYERYQADLPTAEIRVAG